MSEETLRIVDRDGALEFSVRVSPRASRTKVMGLHDGAMKISLAAPPVDGEANAELIAFLARELRVPKASLTLAVGERSKSKVVRASGIKAEALLALFPSR